MSNIKYPMSNDKVKNRFLDSLRSLGMTTFEEIPKRARRFAPCRRNDKLNWIPPGGDRQNHLTGQARQKTKGADTEDLRCATGG